MIRTHPPLSGRNSLRTAAGTTPSGVAGCLVNSKCSSVPDDGTTRINSQRPLKRVVAESTMFIGGASTESAEKQVNPIPSIEMSDCEIPITGAC